MPEESLLALLLPAVMLAPDPLLSVYFYTALPRLPCSNKCISIIALSRLPTVVRQELYWMRNQNLSEILLKIYINFVHCGRVLQNAKKPEDKIHPV
jgi:hypothetical protein